MILKILQTRLFGKYITVAELLVILAIVLPAYLFVPWHAIRQIALVIALIVAFAVFLCLMSDQQRRAQTENAEKKDAIDELAERHPKLFFFLIFLLGVALITTPLPADLQVYLWIARWLGYLILGGFAGWILLSILGVRAVLLWHLVLFYIPWCIVVSHTDHESVATTLQGAANHLYTKSFRHPSGIYKSTGTVIGVEVTYQADFRADGSCYYSPLGESSARHTWTQDRDTIKILEGERVVETLQFDGDDLVPVADAKARRFVKQ